MTISPKFQAWLMKTTDNKAIKLDVLAGDASFRRYFRLKDHTASLIAVDSPPATENNAAFVSIAHALKAMAIRVPDIHAYDLNEGFLLLSDFGDDLFLHRLNKNNADHLYQKAILELAKLQKCDLKLEHFDESWMRKELENFQHWLLETHLKLSLTPATKQMLNKTFNLLLEAATSQPQCFIHRDYHSRNLMCLPDDTIGILDFQDAMLGPVTYDIVSLIRDCYIDWPDDQVNAWANFFYQQCLKDILPNKDEFSRYFDLMGIQRHLKASFIFARKFHRDNVDNYLNDIPRAMGYVRKIAPKYPELSDFTDWLEDTVVSDEILVQA